jgi:hypothetical protein
MNWNNTVIYAYIQQNQTHQRITQSLPASAQLQSGSPPTLEFRGNTASSTSALLMTIFDYGANALSGSYGTLSKDGFPVTPPSIPFPNGQKIGYGNLLFNNVYNYAPNGFPINADPVGLDTNPPGCPIDAVDSSSCRVCRNDPQNCEIGNPDCSVTGCGDVLVIEGFTGSFGYTEVNFATIWLRTQFFILKDIWLGEIIGGGINFANSGDSSGVVTGFFGLIYEGVFLGNTQNESPYADWRGPVYPGASLTCLHTGFPTDLAQVTNALCLLPEFGTSFSYNSFGVSQHFLHIYDGPMGAINSHVKAFYFVFFVVNFLSLSKV